MLYRKSMSKKSHFRAPMSGREFKQCLDKLDLGEAEYAELMGMSHGTINRRCNDKSTVPSETAVLLRILSKRTELMPLVYTAANVIEENDGQP